MERYIVCTNSEGQLSQDEKGDYLIYDSTDQIVLSVSLPVAMQMGLIRIGTDSGTSGGTGQSIGEPDVSVPSGDLKQQVPVPVTWKDENAVKALIAQWKRHEPQFKSCSVRNEKVWTMISDCITKENPLWIYTGKQCENKFKDIKKVYTKTKDFNLTTSGQPTKTCKFYDELEEALGDTPIIKPKATSSSSRKRKENEEDHSKLPSGSLSPASNPASTSSGKGLPAKRSRLSRDLDKFAEIQREFAKKRQKESEKRHEEKLKLMDRAITAYEKAMAAITDKL